MTTRSEYGFDPTALITHKYGHRLHELKPLLKTETFTVKDNEDVDADLAQGLLPRLIAIGGLTIDKRMRTNGTRYCQYRWAEGVRAGIREYLDDLEGLPCGHRWHIYNPPDTDADELSCKFCDATHSRAAVRAAKEGGE